jgi:hypothetical protein
MVCFRVILSKPEVNQTTCSGHAWVPCVGELGGKSSVVLVMNGFRRKPKRGHVTMAVALIGAAVTLGFAIWQSQKGKHQVPAIIDQPVLEGQR